MIISQSHRFVYFGPPRTGSSSLTKLFVMRFGGEYTYWPQVDPNPARFLTDIGRAQHQIVLPVECKDFLTILSVRDPYSRFCSLYAEFGSRHGCQRMEEYFPWAEPPISREVGEIRIDHLIRFESLLADVHALPFVPGPIPIPHERRTISPPPLTDEARSFVREFYRDDFERYDYRK